MKRTPLLGRRRLAEKSEEETPYEKFYKEFGKNLKMGCYEDDSNRSKISKLLRFQTNKADKEISLDKYAGKVVLAVNVARL